MWGKLHSTDDGRIALRYERRFSHPPEKVWRVITEPAHFRQWYPFARGDMDLRVGGKIGFDDGEGTTYEGIITALDPPRIFAFREVDDLLGIEVRAESDGCRLIFTHTFDDKSMATDTAVGWHRCLDAMGMLVDDKPVTWPDNAAELHEAYAKRI
jgi:uncharacterized protein YndB with AHSA1/START domain